MPRLVCQTSAMRLGRSSSCDPAAETQPQDSPASGVRSLVACSSHCGNADLPPAGRVLTHGRRPMPVAGRLLRPSDHGDPPVEAPCPFTDPWLADNPRLSARACCAVLDSVPTLTALDVSASDFWLDELPHFICALQAAPALRWAGCDDGCSWLDASVLRQLQSIPGLQVAAPSELVLAAASRWLHRRLWQLRAHRLGAGSAPHGAPLDSWEDIGDALLGASGEESAGGPSRSSSAAAFACRRHSVCL